MSPGEPDGVGDEEEFEDEDDDGEAEELPENGSEVWQAGVICPDCGSEETRLLERRHEALVYVCARCGSSFEVEA